MSGGDQDGDRAAQDYQRASEEWWDDVGRYSEARFACDDGAEGAMVALVPEHLREGLWLYVDSGIEPGGFLRCVVENDLSGAVARAADDAALVALRGVVLWLHNYATSRCHGSREARLAWQELRGRWARVRNERALLEAARSDEEDATVWRKTLRGRYG